MNDILRELHDLSKSAKILQPDQTIEIKLIHLRLFLKKEEVDSEKQKKIETVLLSLFKINKGDIGIACSTEIGHCLCMLYRKDPNKHFWNLITEVTKQPNASCIYAIKYVISKLGMYNKSSMNQVATHILGLTKDQKLHYPILVATRSLFKTCKHSFPKLSLTAFNFCKQILSNISASKASSIPSERIQIAALQLLLTIVSEPEIQTKRVLLIAQQVFSESKSKFVNLTAANLVAHCAVRPFLKKMHVSKPKDDNDLESLSGSSAAKETLKEGLKENSKECLKENMTLKESFETILMFKPQFSQIFEIFLDKIPPKYIYLNIDALFNFVIQNSVEDVKYLIAFFGKDVRSIFFDSIQNNPAKGNTKSFHLQRLLIYDEFSAREVAGVAHDKIWSSEKSEQKEAMKFFSMLSKSYKKVALESLHVSLHYIAMPPDDSPTLKNEYYGQALIASIILSELDQKLCEKEKPLITKFINYVLLNDNYKRTFIAVSLFLILTTQTSDFINELGIINLLNKIANKFVINDTLNNADIISNNGNNNNNGSSNNNNSNNNNSNSNNNSKNNNSKNNNSKNNNSKNNNAGNNNNNTNKIAAPNLPIKLIETILTFHSVHCRLLQIQENSQKLGEFCFSIVDQLSTTGLMSLLRLFKVIGIESESFAFSFASYFLNKSLLSTISLKFIKKRVPALMKVPEELFFKENNIPSLENNSFNNNNKKGDDSVIFSNYEAMIIKFIDILPKLFMTLNAQNAQILLSLMLQAPNRISGFMNILSILQNNEASSHLPKNIHILIANEITNESNEIALQIASACIATHISRFPQEIKNLLPLLMKETIASCFIETSLARYVNLTEDTVANIVLLAVNRMKNPLLTKYVLHELSTIYELKSVQLMNLMMGDQQYQQILAYIIGKDIPIISMYHSSVCFEKLIPILLPHISDKSTFDMILLSLNEFHNSPVKFYRQFFYDTFRSYFAFVKQVAQFFEIKIPKVTMKIETKLSACGALADLEKYKPFLITNIIDYLPPFFVLLQRTKDPRVSNFLLSVTDSVAKNFLTFLSKTKSKEDIINNNNNINASSPNNNDNSTNEEFKVNSNGENNIQELINWFKMTNQILSRNSILGFDAVNVEPNIAVKSTTLLILKTLLLPLQKTEPFLVECLDDAMTSTIRAIETKKNMLYQTSFEILTVCINLFKSFETDQTNVRLLSLYESQFSNAIKVAFSDSIDIAYVFLESYLDFSFERYKENKENCNTLISTYITSIKRITDKTTGYYAIVTKLAAVSEKYKDVFEISKEFLQTQIPFIRENVKNSIELRAVTANNGWQKITLFRSSISPYYFNLLSSFVWLKKLVPEGNEEFTINYLVSFFVSEASSAESWRTVSAFNALSTTLHYFGSEIDNESFESILTTCSKVYNSNKMQILPLMPDFLLYVTRLTPPESRIWPPLSSLALSSRCYAETLGMLLMNIDSEMMTNGCSMFTNFVINELRTKVISESEAIAIITILFSKCPTVISEIIDMLFQDQIECSPSFLLISLERASKRSKLEEVKNISKISSFLISVFANGGLQTVAKIAIRSPKMGALLMESGIIEESFTRYEGIDAMTLLYFYELILDNFDHSENILINVSKASANLIVSAGNDRVAGLKVTAKAAELIQKCKNFSDIDSGSEAFNSLNEQKKAELMRILKKYSAQRVVKKVSLVKFTGSSSRRRNNDGDGGWQSLDDMSD